METQRPKSHSSQRSLALRWRSKCKVDRVVQKLHLASPSPEPAFVLARDRQLHDLVRFCTVAEGFSILTVDPTFNLGDFDVTPTIPGIVYSRAQGQEILQF